MARKQLSNYLSGLLSQRHIIISKSKNIFVHLSDFLSIAFWFIFFSTEKDLNFQCSTIDARDKIKTILNNNSIDMIDPLDEFNKYAEISYFNENYNNMYLFHPYDTNHPNKIGHYIMGKKLYSYLFDQLF